ncbi:NAD(P)-binding protein [Mycena maculata]|uniref:NAD(P)-binding protein n=1 Tax=Mycena maculata TaxID=230809 RepID=A0AAD7P261_9AGAR|nr:NAD(P)-binding protein [Mycena maculata]
MVISKEASAPLVVVVGITGKQGGSVVRALKASDREYRIRGLTRDITKPAAQVLIAEGVQMVGVSLTADNEEGARNAFQGADIIFAVTNFNEHFDATRELSEGKMLVDAAKFVGVKLFIWSGLESFKEFSDGRYPGVTFFESKAAVSAYARRVGIPLAVVVAGFYMTNIFDHFGLKRGPDEVYSFSLPAAPGTLVPFIDVEADYGRYVRAAIESPGLGAGAYIRTGGSISFEDIISQAAEVTGKKIVYNQISREAYIEPAANKEIGNLFANMFEAYEHVGYYGTDKPTSEDILDGALKSWVDFLKENPPKFPA